MHYTGIYQSPLGALMLAADEVGIVGIWFSGAKHYACCLDKDHVPRETAHITEGKRWLDVYFIGEQPGFTPPIHMIGTPFQRAVWEILLTIPYGSTATYRSVAEQVAKATGANTMSAQAVGTVVGKNNISLIVPCHRVVGANNSLAGYAGGIDKKVALLKLEGGYQDKFFVPKHSTAP